MHNAFNPVHAGFFIAQNQPERNINENDPKYFLRRSAMLVAALCMSAPAVATDYSPAVYTLSLNDFDYDVPAVFKVEATVISINTVPDRSTNSHAAQYASYN